MDYLGGDLACACGVLRAYSTLRSYHVGRVAGLDGRVGGCFVRRILDTSVADLILGGETRFLQGVFAILW